MARVLQGVSDDAFNGRIRHRPRGTGARFIQQPIEAVGHKALPPFTDRLRCDPYDTGYSGIRLSLSTGQNNPGSLRQRLRGLRTAYPPAAMFLVRSSSRSEGASVVQFAWCPPFDT